MIEVLDACGSGYIPELGDGFDGRLEGNPSGLRVCHYAAPAQGAGIYRIIYRITVREAVGALFVFAGRKQLLRFGSRRAGEVIEGEVYLHIGEVIPRYHTEAMRVERIGFAVACDIPENIGETQMRIVRMEEGSGIPAVFLGGDSTVTDQVAEVPYLPGGCYASWGQALAGFIGGSAAVDNQAQSGLSTESFRELGYWDIILRHIRPGDYCLLQFGHNDQKLAHLQAYTGYRENLLRFVRELRERAAVPVLVTPLARNTWKGDGTYNDLLEEHAQSVCELGKEEGVPVIDLHRYAMDLIRGGGSAASRVYFHPGDMTHTNEFGAWLFARYIAHGLCAAAPSVMTVKETGDGMLLPDAGAGIVTGAAADRNLTREQKEVFDAIEKSEAALVKAVEDARRAASQDRK